MKKLAAVLILLAFSVNTAVAYPMGEGGGSQSDDGESNLSTILIIVVTVGVAGLLVSDILADNAVDSQDALSGTVVVEEQESTGIDWTEITGDQQESQIPVVGISVFNSENGRLFADYFFTQVEQGNQVFYELHGTPVSLGSMSPEDAAATGFAFMDCDWFIAGDGEGLALYSRNASEPLWQWSGSPTDSSAIRSAATSFRDFAEY